MPIRLLFIFLRLIPFCKAASNKASVFSPESIVMVSKKYLVLILNPFSWSDLANLMVFLLTSVAIFFKPCGP